MFLVLFVPIGTNFFNCSLFLFFVVISLYSFGELGFPLSDGCTRNSY